jgi:3-oxoacyl-[acyl-carrier protein] reductase
MKFLITGASSDIGRAIAKSLSQAGHCVTATVSSSASLESIRKIYDSEGIACELVVFDLAAPSEIDTNVDGVILNACSKVGRLKRFADLDLADSLQFIDTNLKGNLWLLHKVVKAQSKTKLGRNVLISSVSATMGTSRYGTYCLVKSGLEGLFRNLAVDYGHMNVFFNTLRPGIIATGRHEAVRARAGYNEAIVSRIPAGKVGTPEQIALAISSLLDAGSYINGAHLEVSGGLPMFRADVG